MNTTNYCNNLILNKKYISIIKCLNTVHVIFKEKFLITPDTSNNTRFEIHVKYHITLKGQVTLKW